MLNDTEDGSGWACHPCRKYGGSHARGGGFQPQHRSYAGLRLLDFRYKITLMCQEASELLKKALDLPVAERAGYLIESLDEAGEESVQAAWDDEIGRRMEDLNSGEVKPVSLEEFRRRLSTSLD